MFISKKELEGLRDFVNKALEGAANAHNRIKKVEDKIDNLFVIVNLFKARIDVLEEKKTKKKK